ncbi:unnamed protein product, partial [marine sediment metagenome]
MKNQLKGLEKNAAIRKMLELNPEEIEQTIVYLRKSNLIPKDPERFLNGLGRRDKITAFGSEKNFNVTYKMLVGEQYKLAAKIQADIAGKTTIRIPKELNALAAKARTFTKPVNFATAIRGKLSEVEKTALDQTIKVKPAVAKERMAQGLPAGWKVKVEPNWRKRPGWRAEVSHKDKTIYFESKADLKNIEVVNHEIAHILVENKIGYIRSIKDSPILKKYATIVGELGIHRNFVREHLAMDYGDYLTNPSKVSPRLAELFNKYFPKEAKPAKMELNGIDQLQ